MTGNEKIRDLDLSPFLLSDVIVRGVRLRARQPVKLVPVVSDDRRSVGLVHEPWGLDVFVATRTELLVEAKEQLVVVWEEYAQAPDEVLSGPAQRVKRRLLTDWTADSPDCGGTRSS